MSFTAAPVAPDSDEPVAWAPELEKESATPTATTSPVSPVSPVEPDTAGPLVAVATPRMASLVAVGLESALPELPELPELPDVPDGLAVAEEDALPVSPVLVDEA